MKNIIRLSILIILVLCIDSCKKDNTLPPSVITISATNLSNTSARLNGTVNANYGSTTVSFEYGLTTSYGEIIQVQDPISGSTTETIASDITGLTSGVTYHYRVKAINEKGTTFGEDMQFTTLIVDADGNHYDAVSIGNQVWIKQNLKTTKYKDGTDIPLVTDNTAWFDLRTPGYCWYDNDAATYKATYGALYNWYTVNTGNLCPAGWHVPTDAEWTTLENYLIANGFNYDGTTTNNKYAKSLASSTLWTSSATEGVVGNTDYPGKRNETGFTALPGGARSYNGICFVIEDAGYWWSAKELDFRYAWARALYFDNSIVYRYYLYKGFGLSVRCVRD